jgi:hypothetical protein
MSQRELRIGDAERESAVAALGEHYVAGRLTKEEFDDRTAVAWQARTHADLRPLFVDLPLLQPQEQARPRAAVTPSRGSRPRGGPPLLPILLLAVVVMGVLHIAPWPLLIVLAILWVKFVAFRMAGRGRGSSPSRPTSPPRPGEPWRRYR